MIFLLAADSGSHWHGGPIARLCADPARAWLWDFCWSGTDSVVAFLKFFSFSSPLCSALMSPLPFIVLLEFSSSEWEPSTSVSTLLQAWSLVWPLVVFWANLLSLDLGSWFHCRSCLHLVFLVWLLLDLTTVVVWCCRDSKEIWSVGSRIWAFPYWRSYIQHLCASYQQADSHRHCLHRQMTNYSCKRDESGRLPGRAPAFHFCHRKGKELSWVHSFGSVRSLSNAR